MRSAIFSTTTRMTTTTTAAAVAAFPRLVLVVLATTAALSSWSSCCWARAEEQEDTSVLEPIEILLKLYEETHGLHWDVHDKWLEDDDYCHGWYGIRCYQEEDDDDPDDDDPDEDDAGNATAAVASNPQRIGHVREIDLHDNHLVGTLPSEVFQLPYLESLVLRDNPDLVVPLRAAAAADDDDEDDDDDFYLKEADHLKMLMLSSTDTKSLDGISAVKDSLERLHITSLYLGGGFPKELLLLTKLQGLYANFNDFTGTLPTELGDLTDLMDLYLYDNDLSGELPTQLGLLSNLVVLSLANNAFTGSLPHHLNHCDALQILGLQREDDHRHELRGPGFTGTLPHLHSLEHLTELYLQNNAITGTLSSKFLLSAPRDEVVRVDLRGNRISGAVPPQLAELARLELDLASNLITGVDADELCPNIDGWFRGAVGDIGTCDAFLCPPQTYAPEGRQTSAEDPCRPCDLLADVDDDLYGHTRCIGAVPGSGHDDDDDDNNSNSTNNNGTGAVNEREILITLYKGMGGRFWKKNSKWMAPNEDVCDWHGIRCTTDDQTGKKEVYKIDLKANGLTSSVPPEVFALPKLHTLLLNSNSIDFKFKGIGIARNLRVLDLAHTDLSSLHDIEELADTGIAELKLNSNYLQGKVPHRLFDLRSLTSLSFSYNRLTGTLPKVVHQLSLLRTLKAYDNSLSGTLPTELGRLTQLEVLDLAENDFNGTLPSALGRLTMLQSLSLHQTTSPHGIGGPLPALSDLSQLTSIGLDSNRLGGPLPTEFLSNTEHGDDRIEIRLADNALTGTIPADWADRFDDLYLDATGNLLTGFDRECEVCDRGDWMDGDVEDFGCDALLCPAGTYNEFGRQTDADSPCRPCVDEDDDDGDDGDRNAWFGRKNCSATSGGGGEDGDGGESESSILKELYFATGGPNWANRDGWIQSSDYCGDWHGVVCDEDGRVVKIALPENGLTGKPAPSIFDLERLTELDLQKNSIRFDFAGIGRAANLRTVYLSNTNLDSLDGIRDARNLELLHLTEIGLDGKLPSDLLELTSLRKLFMNYNHISGRLPNEIFKWSNLEELYLLHNKLTGQIPAAIGAMTSCRVLSLTENFLTGTLPNEIDRMESMEIFAVQREDGSGGDGEDTSLYASAESRTGPGLTGTLPALSSLKHVRQLYLGANSLTGPIPFNFLDGVSDKSRDLLVDLVRNDLTGTVPASLTQFDNLTLYLAGNQFEEIADGICKKSDWMRGDVGAFGCDAFLCPPGKFTSRGRQFDAGSECKDCPADAVANYYGTFECLDSNGQQAVEEKDTLKMLYQATNGDGWEVNTNWKNSDASICDWYGISCVSPGVQSVSSISLPRNGLSGTIPTDIWTLPNLMAIDFGDQPVHVDFDDMEGSKLEYVTLDNTGLDSLGGIHNIESTLKLLNINNNDFEGFPPEIAKLPKLEVLYLSENSIESIPTTIGKMTWLKTFSCVDCELSGAFPGWVGKLSGLGYLSFRQNSFTGLLDSGIFANMTELRELDLSDQVSRSGGEGFAGPLPVLTGLTKLKEVYLNMNSFQGPLPTNFMKDVAVDAEDLVTVDLRDNELTGGIPEAWAGRFPSLTLYLANNMIDEVPDAVCAMEKWNDGKVEGSYCGHILCPEESFNALGRAVKDLPCAQCPGSDLVQYFGSTQCGENLERDIVAAMFVDLKGKDWIVSDGWMEETDVCSWYGIECYDSGDRAGRIQNISLEDNMLEGTLSSNVFELEFLENLFIKKNPLHMTFDGIQNALNLKTLYLSETKVTSLDMLSEAPALEALHLTGNGISGGIPPELYDLVGLKRLYLNYNSFTGSVATNVGMLSHLEELYLFHNALTGTIPTQIGLLSSIEVLGLGENVFRGTIPTELNKLSAARIISFQRESGLDVDVDAGANLDGPIKLVQGLEGPLPSLDNLDALHELYLGGNNLTGTIPKDFLGGVTDLSQKFVCDLTENGLSGSIPAELARFDDLRLFLAGNQISKVPDEICDRSDWMSGLMSDGCDALLCEPGFFNDYGRRISKDKPCVSCAFNISTRYYGSLSCGRTDEDTDTDERGVLIKMYDELDGNSWKSRDNWREDNEDICDWHGVHCASEDDPKAAGVVTKIELASNGLKGTLPPIVFHLKNLRELDLQGNEVALTFEGIGLNPTLEQLRMDRTATTSLRGISQLLDLRDLHLEDNKFGGHDIPEEVFTLTNLERLHMSNSEFAGTLPTRIGNMVKLREFYCHGNELSGVIPSEIGQLEALEVLELSENAWFGTLPSELDKLKELKALFIDSFTKSGAGITGPLPSFSGLSKIRDLQLGDNTLTGSIPDDFLSGIDITDATINVALKSNMLTGTVPGDLSRFDKLTIDLVDNQIEDIDDGLCSQHRWMDGAVKDFGCDAILCPVGTYNTEGRQSSESNPCQECPESPDKIMGSTNCATVQKAREKQVLSAFYKAMGGSKWKVKDGWSSSDSQDICSWWGVSCNGGGMVESVVLGANNLHGAVPKELFDLESLKLLGLYSNPIDFTFEGIENARNLRTLLIDATGLRSLEGMGRCVSLREVDIRHNQLKGKLPESEFAKLRDLKTLSASHNQFTGTLPSFIGNRRIATLRLGNNMLQGTLPPFLQTAHLTELDVSDNQLRGSIPSDFLFNVDPTEEITLDLSLNDLTGTVPSDLKRFNHMTLYLKDNKFEAIDPDLCFAAKWNQGDVGTFECDGILCPPKTYAPNLGRASRDGTNCFPCDDAPYYGATRCESNPYSAASPADPQTRTAVAQQQWMATAALALVAAWVLCHPR